MNLRLNIESFENWCESVIVSPANEYYESIYDRSKHNMEQKKRDRERQSFHNDRRLSASLLLDDIKRYENSIKTINQSDPKYKIHSDILRKYRSCYNRCNSASNMNMINEIKNEAKEYEKAQLAKLK